MSKPFVLIKLDKERELRISNKSFIYFEEVAGFSIFEAMNQMANGNISVLVLNKLLFAGLKAMDKDITLEQVYDLVDEYGEFNVIMEKVNEAMMESSFLKMANNNTVTHPAVIK